MSGGEEGFIAWLRESAESAPSLVVPLGDDAAVWSRPEGAIVLAADVIAEGTHFDAGTRPELIGRKALAVNLSDLAAMAARPLCALATCALPSPFAAELPRRVTAGMREVAHAFQCPLVGGDTVTHGGGIVLSVTVMGTPVPGGPVRRDGARPDDVLAVTGALGGSRTERHLTFTPRLAEATWLAENGPPTAMMDVSDGLLIDLHRLATASGCGFRLEADRVPVHADARRLPGDPRDHALGDGEDFELLLSAPPHVMERLQADWNLETPLTVIGEITDHARTLVREGRETEAPVRGYEHR